MMTDNQYKVCNAIYLLIQSPLFADALRRHEAEDVGEFLVSLLDDKELFKPLER